MPPVRTSRNRKPPPEGFDEIEDTLLEFSNKMKDAENASHDGKKKHEMLWPIFQISHQRMFLRCLPFVYLPCQVLMMMMMMMQDQDTFTICTTKKKRSRNSCTSGYSRTGMQMQI